MPTHRHRYYLGRKSKSFEVVDQDLIVVESAVGVAQARVVRVDTGRTLEPQADLSRGGNGFTAFSADPGEYCVEGVELVPVKVTRWVRYARDTGFVEIPKPTAPAVDKLSPLKGVSEQQVKFGERIRQQALAAVGDDAALKSRLSEIHYANWFISRKNNDRAMWIEQIRSMPPSRT